MIIDQTTHKLPNDNYIAVEYPKSHIVFGHTFNHDMRHVLGWLHRYHGKYKKTAAFTIAYDGTIYNHFNPKYYSKILKNDEQDKKTIVILLENDGWLLKDVKNNAFITWTGDIYRQQNDIVEKRWRDYSMWAPYTEKQFDSAIGLVKMLCEQFNIPLTSINHNTKIDSLVDYKGVICRSNLEKHFTDLSPAWDFERFKNKLELT